MTTIQIRTNSPRAWLLAARPKTLTGAATPVILAIALAIAHSHTITLLPALLCLLFALVMQVDANFINDYYDWRRGNDNPATRLGPDRACTMGWITPTAMRRGIIVTTVIACVIGLPLIIYGGWMMILIGAICVLFCFLYTTALAAKGLGDLLVIVFFGIVPVAITFYLLTGTVTPWVITLAVVCGCVIDNLLIVNNVRDADNDRRDGKNTLVVQIGKRAAIILYFFFGAAATFVVFIFANFHLKASIMFVYLVCHCQAYRQIRHLTGKELNRTLAATARNNLIFGISAALVAVL